MGCRPAGGGCTELEKAGQGPSNPTHSPQHCHAPWDQPWDPPLHLVLGSWLPRRQRCCNPLLLRVQTLRLTRSLWAGGGGVGGAAGGQLWALSLTVSG